MAVSIASEASGSASSAAGLTIHAADFGTSPAVGDLLVFCYATDFKAFGNGDWLANTGWNQVPTAFFNGDNGCTGMVYHIVQTGETSWTPVNDAGNNVAGSYICFRVQGHAPANPIVNFTAVGVPGSGSGSPIPENTVPGSDLAFGMTITTCMEVADTVGITGGVSGGANFTNVTQTDPSGGIFQAAYVPMLDAITPSSGTWKARAGMGDQFLQFGIQAAPLGPTDNEYMVKEEFVPSQWAPVTDHLAFNISWTPTVGNKLLVLLFASDLFDPPSSMPSGWTQLLSNGLSSVAAIWAGVRTVQTGDGTSYDLGALTGSNPNAGWYACVMELASVEYQGEADGLAPEPMYTTPNEPSSVGPTINFYLVGIGLGVSASQPQYSMESSQYPDGCAISQIPFSGSNFMGAVSHQIARAGGQGSTGMAGLGQNGTGASVIFSLGPVPCPPTPPSTTRGTLYPVGVPDARISVYNAGGTVKEIEVRDDLIGGQIQYEDTPSGCGACTLGLGIHWEQMVKPGGSLSNAYWIARNIVEISVWDDVIQEPILAGATKIYVGSRYAYDPLMGHDTQQLILDDGVNVTYRIPVTGVGTDSGGDFVTVGAPGSYPGSPTSIPAYAAGTKIFRRRYTGIIMRRGLWNDRQPQGQVTLTGLAQYLTEAVGTFTINIDEVGNAIYNCVNQFASRWPQLVINSANFPYTAQAYSGSNQQYTLADEITQILSCGITNGDTWVVRVGHDWTVRLMRLYSQSCLEYDYTVELDQGVEFFEAQFVQGQDEDVSNFYNSIEVTGDTNPTTKQPYGAIVQDAASIALFGQVDGVPISNTSCKSDSDCALYAQALLDDNAIPRNNYQVKVFTYTDGYPSNPPMGLTRGDVILGVHNVLVTGFESGSPNINGLCMSVVTTMDIKTADCWQEARFAQIEPSWNLAMAERGSRLAITLRHNVLPPVSVQSYMVGPFADQYAYTQSSLVVKNKAFQAVFDYGTTILTVPATNITLPASTTAYVFLDNTGAFHVQSANPIPADASWMLHSIFQTSSAGVIGDIFKAPRGPLGTSGSGPGSGTVTEIDQGTGIALSPNPIVISGSVGLAAISGSSIMANIGGGSGVPVGVTLSALLDALVSGASGTLIYRSGTGWTNLPIGSASEVLTVMSGEPSWQPGGGGATIGYGTSFPGSPTDGELFFRTDLRAMFMYLASSPGPGWFSDQSLAQLEDVALSSPANLDYLQYNGADWVNTPLTVPTIGSLPTAGSAYRGRIVKVLGSGTGTADAFYICRMRQDGSYIWTRFQGRSVVLSFASGEFTPSTTGKDVIVREAPYDPEEPGSPTVIAWTVVDIVFRIETPATSGTCSLKVQRSTGTGVFSNTGYLNTTSLDITSGNYEPASSQKPCPLAVTSINSGDKLSPEYTAVGAGSGGYSAYVVLRES